MFDKFRYTLVSLVPTDLGVISLHYANGVVIDLELRDLLGFMRGLIDNLWKDM